MRCTMTSIVNIKDARVTLSVSKQHRPLLTFFHMNDFMNLTNNKIMVQIYASVLSHHEINGAFIEFEVNGRYKQDTWVTTGTNIFYLTFSFGSKGKAKASTNLTDKGDGVDHLRV